MSPAPIPLPSFTPTWRNDTYPTINPKNFTSSITGKTVFITGGGSGQGPTIAQAFATAGASTIAISGRTEKTLQATKANLEATFPKTKILALVADSTDGKAVDAAFQKVGKVDILINGAGYLPDGKTVADASKDDWWKGFEVNVLGSFIVAKAFLKVAAEKDAVLINVTTGGAHFPASPGKSAYSASKLAAIKMFEGVQVENPHIRVVNVHPGVLKTEMANKSREGGGPEFPIDRLELPAHFILWASTPAAAFLQNKVVWANWDVDELKAREGEITGGGKLSVTLAGFGADGYSSAGVGKGWDDVQ